MAFYRLKRTQAPVAEPLGLEEMKTYLRLEHDDDDALVQALITTARELCETFTGRALMVQKFSLQMDRWPSAQDPQWWDGVRDGVAIDRSLNSIDLPRAPVTVIDSVVVYDDLGGSREYSSAHYYLDSHGMRHRFCLRHQAPVPQGSKSAGAIEILFTAGYASALDVPQALKQGMRQIVAHLYEHRGDAVDVLRASKAEDLFKPFRITGMLA